MAINKFNPTPEQINAMLQLVGQKLNTDPARLRSMIEKGDINGITSSMSGDMGKQLNSVLGNPEEAKKMASSADLSGLLSKLKKG